ncbi:hypothetical protein DACRYDRAFT_22917 [Dacryopinax primogenitus]|uniref:Uncharacterized protein n=1 Tax=Dacryopinax primogenitus (strain DJM 731) TaxID=1858805 RepID=M5G5S6_DACPD|nr:uncharacterized protein DACRYDRAFT_22917 [Dacryopinax primogenitus]EJU01147.1 hypothetical protein DACRYDRAFT_22917 [Dacryopinax primogenitus]
MNDPSGPPQSHDPLEESSSILLDSPRTRLQLVAFQIQDLNVQCRSQSLGQY